jgi:hypothetical protein
MVWRIVVGMRDCDSLNYLHRTGLFLRLRAQREELSSSRISMPVDGALVSVG